MLQVPDVIVESDWLYDHIDHPNLILLDATIKKVTSSKSSQISSGYIPKSIFFDLKNIFSDQESLLPNTVLSFSKFEDEAQNLGINNDSCIVVYDNLGIYSSPRVFWLFRLMGFLNVAVLNGGVKAWMENKFPLVTERKLLKNKGNFKVNYIQDYFSSMSDVRNAISQTDISIIDARAEDRFLGLVDEPREGLSSGHIPNSSNIHFEKVLKDNKLASKATLKNIFNEKGIPQKKAIFTCGSGITASILALAAEYIDINNYSVYDGSWTEWGSNLENSIEK